MADTMNKDSNETKQAKKEKAGEKNSAENVFRNAEAYFERETAQVDKSGGPNRKEFSLDGETNTDVEGEINVDTKIKRQ